jgi:hypothetical protein
VLAGLWMMHGMNATTDAGCHGMAMATPMAASMTGTAPKATAPSAAVRGASTRANSVESGATGSGELCLSGQPPAPGATLLALLAVAGCALLGATTVRPWAVWFTGRRWRAPPGAAGMDLLTVVCVSRT